MDISFNLKSISLEENFDNYHISLLSQGSNLFYNVVQVAAEEKEEIENQVEVQIEDEIEYTVPEAIDYSNVGANLTVGNVKIKNSTKFSLNEEELKQELTIFKDKTKSQILIVHTHTSESYTPTEKYNYTASGNFRTQNSRVNVVKVGETLKNFLENYQFNVIQDTTYHDYPKYSGSYTRSLATIEKNLNENPNIEIVIDLHRDAISSNDEFRPVANINGEEAAQLMFVVGTNGGGLKHDDWEENLKLAIKIQEKANEVYPRFI